MPPLEDLLMYYARIGEKVTILGNFLRGSDCGKWQCCQQLIFEEGDTTTERDVVGASSDSLDWVGCVDASHGVDMLLCYSKVRLILHGSLKQAVVAQSYIPHCILILLAPRHLKKFYRVQESHAPACSKKRELDEAFESLAPFN